MSRTVVVQEIVECDFDCTKHKGEIINFEWSWNGRDMEVDACDEAVYDLNQGNISFADLMEASRDLMVTCTECDQQFETEARMKQHRTRKHGKDAGR